MKTEALQRRWDRTLAEIEDLRARWSGHFTAQPGHMVRLDSGLLVHEHTDEAGTYPNLVTNQGLNHVLETQINAGSAITVWYLTGFTDNVTPLATHTAAVPGTTEITTTDVAESVRETYNANAASSQSIDNVAGPVAQYIADQSFTMWGMQLIGGGTSAFANTSGTLWASTLLSASRSMVTLDTLDMTYTFPASAV